MLRFLSLLVLLAFVFVAGCGGPLKKADRAFERRDYARAIALYRAALDAGKLKSQDMADIRFKMGRAMDGIGRPDQAVEEYRTAVELQPEGLKYYMAMADDLERLGMCEEEAAVLRNVLILNRDNPHAEAMLGVAYARLGQYVNALGEFRKAILHNPRDPQNYNNLGLIYSSLGDTEKAVSYWEAGLRLKPGDELILQNLGAVYNQLKRYADAARVYQSLTRLRPGVPKFHNQLGIAYYNSGRYKLAYDEFKTVMILDSSFPGVQDYVRLADRGMTRLSKLPSKGR